MEKSKIALFDFDGTLCKGDSSVPFLFFCLKHGIAPKAHLFKAIRAYIHLQFHPEDMSMVKSQVYSYLQGKKVDEVNEIARRFFKDVQSLKFFTDGMKEINRLRSENYYILIVSASPNFYMRVLPEFLPVDGLISTPCVEDDNGVYTGMVGENCKGLQKPLMIAQYLAANHMELDFEQSRAYGDSKHDQPMLSLVRTPMLINAKKALRLLMPDAETAHWK